MTTCIDLTRAARIGAIAELMLQVIAPFRGRGEGVLADEELTLLREASGTPNLDLYPIALSLIGECGIEDVWEEGNSLVFVFELETTFEPMPPDFAQAVRQHGITLREAERVYRESRSLMTLDEKTFVQLCLREVGLPKPAALPKGWEPGPISTEALQRRGVTEQFVEELLPEFLLVFNDNPVVGISADQAFFRFASKRWRQYINAFDESTDLRPLPDRWQPSAQVHRELEKRGFERSQIERVLPEFRLHARERGGVNRHWGLEFVRYCERVRVELALVRKI